jgi:hypothetical protein
MFVGLIDTRDQHPEPVGREPLLIDIPELRPWRWYLATIVCIAVSGWVPTWLGAVLVIAGLCCFFQGVTSYYKGNDGLSQHRQ